MSFQMAHWECLLYIVNASFYKKSLDCYGTHITGLFMFWCDYCVLKITSVSLKSLPYTNEKSEYICKFCINFAKNNEPIMLQQESIFLMQVLVRQAKNFLGWEIWW